MISSARLEEQYQASRYGWVEEKIMEENNIRFMVEAGYLMTRLSRHPE